MGLSDFWHLAPTIRARVGQLEHRLQLVLASQAFCILPLKILYLSFCFKGVLLALWTAFIELACKYKNLTPEVSAELVKIYHNMVLQQLTGIAIELLFARLPWTTFSEAFL